MSRLLFAAARKARIEYPKPDGSGWQIFAMNVPTDRNDDCRIHPDDAHLAYGPISTALREMALQRACVNLQEFPRFSIEAAMACKLDGDWIWRWQKQTPFERSLALLILAEALADEGL